MLRTLKRWFSTEETKHLAEDVDKAADKVLALGHAVEGLQLRVERHLNKLQMRDARSSRGSRDEMVLTEEEQAILDDLRRRGGNGGGEVRFD